MRHRDAGRKLGRNASHRRALMRNLAAGLLRTLEHDEGDPKPKVAGRIVTTLAKAKEVRPFVERLITLAKKSLVHEREAEQWATQAKRHSPVWEEWRQSEQWRQWAQARAPVVAARQRALRLLHDKEAVRILFEKVAAQFEDRPGGYTRILRRPQRRQGDAGPTAILELVGQDDRKPRRRERPTVAAGQPSAPAAAEPPAEEPAAVTSGATEAAAGNASPQT